MGTTKSGRVLNTRGSVGSANQFAVVHSNEGLYTKPSKNNPIRLKNGGHGQTWFPKSWKSKDIKHAGEHVANLKGNRQSKDGVAVFGMWKGV